MIPPVLQLDDIAVYGGERRILDVDELCVYAGESVALIGPNGAGKTTLLHVAALLRRPDAGTVTIRGQRASANNASTLRRSLSVVFQDPLLFDIRVLANAAAGLRFQGCSAKEAETRARGWLERFGVGHLAERKARGLSGGEASRVALARAFATEPALLLLDEPFSALDAPTRAALLPMLRERLRETGTAAVLVTHDLDEAFAFGDRVAVMNGGAVVAHGDAPDLVAHPPSRKVAALLGVETILPAVVRRVDDGYAYVELRPGGPTLRSHPRSAWPLVPGQSVTLTLPAGAATAFRPGADGNRDWNQLPGTVREVTMLPSGTRLVVETPAPIVALAPWDGSTRRWSVGDRVRVMFAPQAAHLIPDDE